MEMDPLGDSGRRGCLGAGCGGGEAGRRARPGSVAGRPGAPAPTEAVRGRGWRRVAHRSWLATGVQSVGGGCVDHTLKISKKVEFPLCFSGFGIRGNSILFMK